MWWLQGIIITATTPTQSAVRLETGVVELQLSNRVENISRPIRTTDPTQPMKIFGKAQVRQREREEVLLHVLLSLFSMIKMYPILNFL